MLNLQRALGDDAAPFKIDQTAIAETTSDDLALVGLGESVKVFTQETFEKSVLRQIERAANKASSVNAACVDSTDEPPRSCLSQKLENIEPFLASRIERSPKSDGEIYSDDDESDDAALFNEPSTSTLNFDDANVAQNARKKYESSLTKKRAKRTSSLDSDSDYVPSDLDNFGSDSSECDVKEELVETNRRANLLKPRHKVTNLKFNKFKDDGSDEFYENRIKKLKKQKLGLLLERIEKTNALADTTEENCVEIKGGLVIDREIWSKLYKYQKTGVRWLWELHRQDVGGILGDEMGLGKTIQTAVFFGALKKANLPNDSFSFAGLGPCLVICPPTVMNQWVREFHIWCPDLRVAVLHDCGSYKGDKRRLIAKIHASHGVLVTSYSAMSIGDVNLQKWDWHYVVLDEGHKIRNPDSRTTLAAKKFRTPHKLILTGTPMQNSLRELWSVFDFVFPGRLGALPDFLREFGVPITQGGYANATETQVRTAYRCACVLRETISPYLLRRTKAEVKLAINLPSKNEQVLFCRLTDHQLDVYRQYLTSRECLSILSSRKEAFVGLINLRKLCNHPDLLTGGPDRLNENDPSIDPVETFGHWERSGKMIVVRSLLNLWRQQNHRVLIFSQSRKLLNIIEKMLTTEKHIFVRLDGTTPIGSRQNVVKRYNEDESIFCFLLTTKVGGLGLNLTGADRVLIYDPDWNPSTDCQAKERAWRIGQTRPVTVYRLLTAGTIEEKIYHRQIFKQFLTNRVLKDPKQRRFFKTNDLHELFTLSEIYSSKDGAAITETGTIFAGTGSDVALVTNKSKTREVDVSSASYDVSLDYMNSVTKSSRKIEDLRLLAKKLSARLMNDNLENLPDKLPKKRRKNAKFDQMARIPFLAKQKVYRSDLMDENYEINEKISNTDDDYVLKSLFKKTNFHSALKHDRIIESSGADYAIVEAEAEKVARQALKALGDSRKMCARAAYLGVPTWTGKNGFLVDGSAPRTVPRFGPKYRKIHPPATSMTASSSSATLFSGSDLVRRLENEASSDSTNLLAAIKRRKFVRGDDDDLADFEEVADEPSTTNQNQSILGSPSINPSTNRLSPSWNQSINRDDPSRSRDPAANVFAGRSSSEGASSSAQNSADARLYGSRFVRNLYDRPADTDKFKARNPAVWSLNAEEAALRPSLSTRIYSQRPLQTNRLARDPHAGVTLAPFVSNGAWRGSPNCSETSNQNREANLESKYEKVLDELRLFLAFGAKKDGQASTNELLKRFGNKIALQDSAVFKNFLKKICNFERNTDGDGVWILKREFR